MSATRLAEEDKDAMDLHVARILAMTDEEVRAEVIAAGEDPDEVVERVRRGIAEAIAKAERIKAGYEGQTQ